MPKCLLSTVDLEIKKYIILSSNQKPPRITVLKGFQNSYSSSDMEQEDENSSSSPMKGALKKGTRENSLTRSPLKVRWKDMIEISNVIDDDYGEPSDEDTNTKENEILIQHKKKMEARDSDEESDEFEDGNDIHFDEDDYDYDEEDENVNSGLEIVKNKLNKASDYESCYISNVKISDLMNQFKSDTFQNRKSMSDNFISNGNNNNNSHLITSDVIITSEKKYYARKYEGKSEQFNLKPLHSTGNFFYNHKKAGSVKFIFETNFF